MGAGPDQGAFSPIKTSELGGEADSPELHSPPPPHPHPHALLPDPDPDPSFPRSRNSRQNRASNRPPLCWGASSLGTPRNWQLRRRPCCDQGATRGAWSPWPAGPRTRCRLRCGPGWGTCARSSSLSASSRASTGCRRSRGGWSPRPHRPHQRARWRPPGPPRPRSRSGRGQSARGRRTERRSCPGGGGRSGRNRQIRPRRLDGGAGQSGRSRWSTRRRTALPWAATSRWSGGASGGSGVWSGRSPANRSRPPERSWPGGEAPVPRAGGREAERSCRREAACRGLAAQTCPRRERPGVHCAETDGACRGQGAALVPSLGSNRGSKAQLTGVL